MSVYSVLRLNKTCGIACADEMVTDGDDVTYKIDVSKMRELTPYLFAGASGQVWISNEVLTAKIDHDDDFRAVRQKLCKAYKDVWVRIREDALRKYSLEWDAVVRGKVEATLSNKVQKEIDGEWENNSTDFILAGYDKTDGRFVMTRIERFGAYFDDLNGEYDVVGSGRDIADGVIARYLERMELEQRTNIPLSEGCRILLDAIQDAWHGRGVGGRSAILWASEKGISRLDYQQTTLLHRMLTLEKRHVVKPESVSKIFKGVVEGNAQLEDTLAEIKKMVGGQRLIELFLTDPFYM